MFEYVDLTTEIQEELDFMDLQIGKIDNGMLIYQSVLINVGRVDTKNLYEVSKIALNLRNGGVYRWHNKSENWYYSSSPSYYGKLRVLNNMKYEIGNIIQTDMGKLLIYKFLIRNDIVSLNLNNGLIYINEYNNVDWKIVPHPYGWNSGYSISII